MPENKHGTADLELGQYNEVLGIVQRALPKAFAGVPYKEFCEVDGAVLEPLLHEAFLRATEGLVLLKRIASIAVPAVRRFVAKDCLKEANVGWTGSSFNRLFRDRAEENIPETTLVGSLLKRASPDAPILAGLEDKAEVSLAHMFDLLKKQAHGEEGVLLTNGYANIFYVRDADGILWAVGADWGSDYRDWDVEAHSIGTPGRWGGGGRVFSRDS